MDPQTEYRVEPGTYSVPAFEGVHGSILFVGPQGQIRMDIDGPTVNLSRGEGRADCVISSDEPDYLVRVVRGEQNLVTALLQGRITVEGDAMLAVQVAGSMPTLQEPATAAGAGGQP